MYIYIYYIFGGLVIIGMAHCLSFLLHVYIYIYIYIYIYNNLITIYAFFFGNVKKYKIHDETFKI